MIRISACIITFNEERNIERCIRSLEGVADEVIVVDSFSKDNTVALAEALGAKVIQRPFNGYGEQKHFAEEQASNDWIFSLDADEALSDELKTTLLGLKNGTPAHQAYEVNILTNYCGKWIRHCGWYPQPKVRFWNRKAATMLSDKVHEGIRMHREEDTVGKLKGDLLHYSYHTISDHIKKIEHYSEVGARFDVERGRRCSILKLLIAPKWQFLSDFILRKGFMDGYYGYIVCRNSAMASYVKYAKIRQYTEMKNKGLSY